MTNYRSALLTTFFIITFVPPIFLLIIGAFIAVGSLLYGEAYGLLILLLTWFGILGFRALFLLFNKTLDSSWHIPISSKKLTIYLYLGIVSFLPVPYYMSKIFGIWHGVICISPLVFAYYLVFSNRWVLQEN